MKYVNNFFPIIIILQYALEQLYVVFYILYIYFVKGILEREERVSLGGYFSMDLGTDIFRSYIYEQYKLHYYRANKNKYSLLIIDRKKNRKWNNLNQLIDFIQVNYSSVSFLIIFYH